MAACTSDHDCRRDEGYVCERGACTLPNLAAISAKQCSGVQLHDKSFGDAEPWGTGTEPAGAITPAGFVAIFTTAKGLAITPEQRTNDEAIPFAGAGHDPVLAHGALYFAAWRDAEAIELATSRDAITWSPPRAIQADDGSALGQPILAASATTLFAMYGDGDTGLRVRTSRDAGASFLPAVTPLAGAYGNAIVDDIGALHIVTLNGSERGGYGSAMQTIEYTTSRDGQTFSAPLVVSGRDELLPTYLANPSVAFDARRKWLYVAYVRGGRDATWDLVIAATKDAGKTWTRRPIGDGCAIHAVPNLALDPITGTLHLAYYDNAGAVGRFVHASCTIGAQKCSVAGAINTLPFASLPLGPRSPLRLGDRESLFVDAKKRVLHAVWSQPVVENDATVSRIFHSQAKLR